MTCGAHMCQTSRDWAKLHGAEGTNFRKNITSASIPIVNFKYLWAVSIIIKTPLGNLNCKRTSKTKLVKVNIVHKYLTKDISMTWILHVELASRTSCECLKHNADNSRQSWIRLCLTTLQLHLSYSQNTFHKYYIRIRNQAQGMRNSHDMKTNTFCWAIRNIHILLKQDEQDEPEGALWRASTLPAIDDSLFSTVRNFHDMKTNRPQPVTASPRQELRCSHGLRSSGCCCCQPPNCTTRGAG